MIHGLDTLKSCRKFYYWIIGHDIYFLYAFFLFQGNLLLRKSIPRSNKHRLDKRKWNISRKRYCSQMEDIIHVKVSISKKKAFCCPDIAVLCLSNQLHISHLFILHRYITRITLFVTYAMVRRGIYLLLCCHIKAKMYIAYGQSEAKWKISYRSENLILQFRKRKYDHYDKSKSTLTTSRRETKHTNPILRLNRAYLIYLGPETIRQKNASYTKWGKPTKNTSKIAMRKMCRRRIPKMKSLAPPDPWTSETRREVKHLLCHGCRKCYNIIDCFHQ